MCAKFQPLNQWLHFDAFEVLPAEHPADAAIADGPGTRYDHQISMFGRAFQTKLQVRRCLLCRGVWPLCVSHVATLW